MAVCSAVGGMRAGSVAGGSCGWAAQIQATIWMPGLVRLLVDPAVVRRAKGPNAVADAATEGSIALPAVLMTRFLMAMQATGNHENGAGAGAAGLDPLSPVGEAAGGVGPVA